MDRPEPESESSDSEDEDEEGKTVTDWSTGEDRQMEQTSAVAAPMPNVTGGKHVKPLRLKLHRILERWVRLVGCTHPFLFPVSWVFFVLSA